MDLVFGCLISETPHVRPYISYGNANLRPVLSFEAIAKKEGFITILKSKLEHIHFEQIIDCFYFYLIIVDNIAI